VKKIGFIDYYINEWHANQYVRWFAQINESMGTDYQVCYAWAEMDADPNAGVTTDAWCEKNHVSRCDTIEELCEKSDYIVVLAPSNPETHLGYAKTVLPYKKRTYIDKTFAPDYETAKEIFRIAKENDCPFFSSSALRYATELDDFSNAASFLITGSGADFAEYLIHTVEMAAILLKSPARKVKTEAIGKHRVCRIVAENGGEAVILQAPCQGFSVTAELENGAYEKADIKSSYFLNLISDILHFFETGERSFDPAQTLEVMKIRTGLLASESAAGNWMTL